MIDLALIKALRCCDSDRRYVCFECPVWEHEECKMLYTIAADRLEALLEENEGLKAGQDTNILTGWRNGRWLPPEVGEYLVHIKYAKTATTLWYAGVRGGEPVWRDLSGEEYEVTHWMPMPEVPEEGAEL